MNSDRATPVTEKPRQRSASLTNRDANPRPTRTSSFRDAKGQQVVAQRKASPPTDKKAKEELPKAKQEPATTAPQKSAAEQAAEAEQQRLATLKATEEEKRKAVLQDFLKKAKSIKKREDRVKLYLETQEQLAPHIKTKEELHSVARQVLKTDASANRFVQNFWNPQAPLKDLTTVVSNLQKLEAEKLASENQPNPVEEPLPKQPVSSITYKDSPATSPDTQHNSKAEVPVNAAETPKNKVSDLALVKIFLIIYYSLRSLTSFQFFRSNHWKKLDAETLNETNAPEQLRQITDHARKINSRSSKAWELTQKWKEYNEDPNKPKINAAAIITSRLTNAIIATAHQRAPFKSPIEVENPGALTTPGIAFFTEPEQNKLIGKTVDEVKTKLGQQVRLIK